MDGCCYETRTRTVGTLFGGGTEVQLVRHYKDERSDHAGWFATEAEAWAAVGRENEIRVKRLTGAQR